MKLNFHCRQCHGLLSVEQVRMEKRSAIVRLICQNEHWDKVELDIKQIKTWLIPVIQHLYICPHCGSDLRDVTQHSDARKTELTLNCPNHNWIKKQISNAFWYIVKKYSERSKKILDRSDSTRIAVVDPQTGYIGNVSTELPDPAPTTTAIPPAPSPPTTKPVIDKQEAEDLLDEAFKFLHSTGNDTDESR